MLIGSAKNTLGMVKLLLNDFEIPFTVSFSAEFYEVFLFAVTPSPVKGKGKAGRPTASKATKEKTPSPKEEDEEPESPPEKKKSASPPPEKSGDEGSEDEAPSGED